MAIQQWNTLFFTNAPNLFVDIHVQNLNVSVHKMQLCFGVIGNHDFELIYTKQYPNLSQLEKAYCDFIDFWQLKYPETKHTLQVDLGSDINIDEIYQMKCLLDAAISCSLCLPENGKGYHLQNDLSYLNYLLEKYNRVIEKFKCKLLEEQFLNLYV